MLCEVATTTCSAPAHAKFEKHVMLQNIKGSQKFRKFVTSQTI